MKAICVTVGGIQMDKVKKVHSQNSEGPDRVSSLPTNAQSMAHLHSHSSATGLSNDITDETNYIQTLILQSGHWLLCPVNTGIATHCLSQIRFWSQTITMQGMKSLRNSVECNGSWEEDTVCQQLMNWDDG